jgi:hypothetical protein
MIFEEMQACNKTSGGTVRTTGLENLKAHGFASPNFGAVVTEVIQSHVPL